MSPRRTRIGIGPGGPLFVLLSVLILVSAIYTQSNLLFWAFGLLVGALVVSVVWCLLTLRTVDVQRLLPGYAIVDEPLTIRYQIRNDSWLPAFNVVIWETWGGARWDGWRSGPGAESSPRLRERPCGWLLHLGSRQVLLGKATCWPTRRGRLELETIHLSTSFPFNIVSKHIEWVQEASTLVYPRIHRIRPTVLHSLSVADPSGRDQLDRRGGTEDFFGLREYRYGDSLRHIDWKRTARSGDLVTRELTQPSPPRMVILLDLRQHAKPVVLLSADGQVDDGGRARLMLEQGLLPQVAARERAISLTASLICESHYLGHQTGLIVLGAAGAVFSPQHGLLHRRRMLEALSLLEPGEGGDRLPQRMPRPSLVVRAGGGVGGHASVRTCDGELMERYIVEGGESGHDLLARRSYVASGSGQVRRLVAGKR